MDDDASSFSDEPRGPAPPGEADPGLVMREPYLRRVLADFEAGHLEAYEYTRRVLAVNAAGSTEEMSAIVNGLSDAALAGADATATRGLDAVDLARLRATRLSESRNPNTRYITLAVVFVLFAVLIGIGMWLATHIHGAALAPAHHRHMVGRLTPWWG